MKKLLIIITLFVSSFFLFCNKEVKADVSKITDSDISYITEDFLLARDKITSNGWKYIAIYDSGTYKFFVFASNSSLTLGSSQFKVSGMTWYKWVNGNFTVVTSGYGITLFASSVVILDCSDDVYPSSSFNVTYNDKIYPVTPETKMVTVYDIYNEINSVPEENPHQEEIDKVTNFYTMIIEKIGYLSEQIANNYILLFIIGIFILIFIFMFIFRRFL